MALTKISRGLLSTGISDSSETKLVAVQYGVQQFIPWS